MKKWDIVIFTGEECDRTAEADVVTNGVYIVKYGWGGRAILEGPNCHTGVWIPFDELLRIGKVVPSQQKDDLIRTVFPK